ncbi:hypothetical protein [Pelosinus sp. IPA-1]|uniref:GbsR/MarR family transcriptional regulator n=1 Tax=Pelosinus sp. IPA-1 TaxID=3029569 RepID=UPI00243619C0|nr:hypothetical protein [Pelosinus sp. IPA-1]GMA97975.1 hypothetical protein PIPA1_07750 [Pelosinus sp. IPA-1]
MNDKAPDENNVKNYIEDGAIVLEKFGWPRMAGRIMVYLTVCDPSYQSHKDIVTYLKASKASVSTMLQLLREAGFVEKIAFPGDRIDYYKIKEEAWHNICRRRHALYTSVVDFSNIGLELFKDVPLEKKKRLEDFKDFHTWLSHCYGKALDEWTSQKVEKGNNRG